MHTVYKYPLTEKEGYIETQEGAEFLTVQTQTAYQPPHPEPVDVPMVWARINLSNPTVRYEYALVGTGGTAPPPGVMRYVGTYQTKDRRSGFIYVWHLFVSYQWEKN